ncbi:hypothetical protein CORC01_14459 [Colletotrichum orchidophilum]|uniref:Uncharacterized protein n=1 Tax=Colletotrichum orchidophilum TaxID=1209926 RepID=A0A1G4AM49_9PEZI|nr:uncharacterized protein CORC01_14459 [Colletotrichum orchidophilum]OHE90247.1 hypothetical protein CORC01_14459 [Colletotrichum orchidophilum]
MAIAQRTTVEKIATAIRKVWIWMVVTALTFLSKSGKGLSAPVGHLWMNYDCAHGFRKQRIGHGLRASWSEANSFVPFS